MSPAPLTRRQRRALERYARGVDMVTASDRRWFEEHPHRTFRVRPMEAAEIRSAEVIGALKPTPAGLIRFTLVHKLGPNSRQRMFIFGPSYKTGEETSEETAGKLWQHYRDLDPQARNRELAIAAIVADHEHGGGDAG